MRHTSVLCLFLLATGSAYALEVDASRFGFTFQLPLGWKVLGNPNPYERPLLAVEKDRKVGIAVRVVTDYVLPRGDSHYAAAQRALPRGAKLKTFGTSVFRTSSNNVGLRTKSDVTTADGHKLTQLFYSIRDARVDVPVCELHWTRRSEFRLNDRINYEDVSDHSLKTKR